jgi:hypothetical protein
MFFFSVKQMNNGAAKLLVSSEKLLKPVSIQLDIQVYLCEFNPDSNACTLTSYDL